MNLIFGQDVLILKAGVVYLRGQDLARVVRSNRSLGPACEQMSGPRLLTCVLLGEQGKRNKTNQKHRMRPMGKG